MSVPREIYLFFLTNKQGHCHYVENGTVKSGINPVWLPEAPDGWLNTEISFARNTKYFGLNRSFSIPLKFVGDGAAIIRHLFYTGKGVEQDLYLNINKWNDETGIYENYYKGAVDLSKIQDDVATSVTANLLESGLLQLIKANENNTYEIPCDGSIPENIKVRVSGIMFRARYNYSFVEYTHPVARVLSSVSKTFSIPMAFLNTEGDSIGILMGNQDFQESDSPTAWFAANPNNYLFSSIAPVSPLLKGEWKFRFGNIGPNVVTVGYGKSKSNGSGSFHVLQTINNASGEITVNLNHTIPLAAGEQLNLLVKVDLPSPATSIFIATLESSLTLEFDSSYKDTEAWAIRPVDLFKLLVAKNTNNTYEGVSTLLEQYSHLAVSCGMSLRNTEKAVIKTSLSDFFVSFNSILNGAIGNERTSTGSGERLFFERKSHVYDSSYVTLDIGEVSDLKISVAQNYFANNIKVGYPEQKYDEKQGMLEYNTTSQLGAPILKFQKELNLVSKYRADSYGVEYTRYPTAGNNTVNNKSDNDVFILCTKSTAGNDGVYELDRDSVTSITGLINPATAYNIKDLTPKQMLLKHGNYIRGFLHNQLTEYLTFLSSDKNKDLAFEKDGRTIIESSDVCVADLDNPLFYPYIIDFKTKVPLTFEQVMAASANGHIRASYNGVNIYGFPEDVSSKSALNDAQEWKLLMSPMTNLSELQDLEINGLNFINVMGYEIFVPHLCPVRMVPLGGTLPAQYHFKHMDEWWFSEQIQHYAEQPRYAQKWQTNDKIELQCQTKDLGPVKVDLINCRGEIVGSFPLANVSDPSVQAPRILYQGTVNLATLTLEEGYYYLLWSAGVGATVAQMISEPLHIKKSHPGTLLYEYYHSKNKQACVFTSGYRPSFRAEGYLDEFNPEALFTTYANQPADIETLDGIPYRTHKLNVGNEFDSVPPWVPDKINRIMLLNNTRIDGKKFSRDSDAKFEKIAIPGNPTKFWTLPVREGKNAQGTSMAMDVPSVQLMDLTVVYDIETSAFGDGAKPSNVVQVTQVDDN